MPVDGVTVLLSSTLEEVTCQPCLITCLRSALGKYLEFPLTRGNLSVNTLNVQTSVQTWVEYFNNVTAKSVLPLR